MKINNKSILVVGDVIFIHPNRGYYNKNFL